MYQVEVTRHVRIVSKSKTSRVVEKVGIACLMVKLFLLSKIHSLKNAH